MTMIPRNSLTKQCATAFRTHPYVSLQGQKWRSLSREERSQEIFERIRNEEMHFSRFSALHDILSGSVGQRRLKDFLPIQVLENGPADNIGISHIVASKGHKLYIKEKEIRSAHSHQERLRQVITGKQMSDVFYKAKNSVASSDIVYWSQIGHNWYSYDRTEHFANHWNFTDEDNCRPEWLLPVDSNLENKCPHDPQTKEHRAVERAEYCGRDVLLGGFLVIQSELNVCDVHLFNEQRKMLAFMLFSPVFWEPIFHNFVTDGVLPTAYVDDHHNRDPEQKDQHGHYVIILRRRPVMSFDPKSLSPFCPRYWPGPF